MSCRSGDKRDREFFLSELSLAFVAPMLKVLEFLRMRVIRFAIKRFPGRWASFLTLLSRKLIVWWRLWFGIFGRPKSAKSPSLENQASSYSVSGGSAVVKEYVIAASYVPTLASHPGLHERTDEQLETVGARPPVPHVDGIVNPVVQPSASSFHTHEPLSPPPMNDLCRRQSSTSVVVDDQNLSTDSLPTSSSTNLPRITDEPIAIDTATGHSSSDPPSMIYLMNQVPQRLPTIRHWISLYLKAAFCSPSILIKFHDTRRVLRCK